MKTITKEEVLDGVLFAVEHLVFGGSLLLAVVGATFGTLAEITTAGSKFIEDLRNKKEEDKHKFSFSKLKVMCASAVNSWKGFFAKMVNGDVGSAPAEMSEVKPPLQAVPTSAAVSSSEGKSLSEDELDELDNAFDNPNNAEGEDSTAK